MGKPTREGIELVERTHPHSARNCAGLMTLASRASNSRAAAKRVRVQFGILLKAARIEAGLSQRDFPGHDQSFISKVEGGTAALKIDTMADLAAVVGRDLDDMLADIKKDSPAS